MKQIPFNIVTILTLLVTFVTLSKSFAPSNFREVTLVTRLHGGMHHYSDDEIYDSEEAAANDAHDVSDPGMEAAAMERAVMMAHEMLEQNKWMKEDILNKKRGDEEVNIQVQGTMQDLTEEPLLTMLARKTYLQNQTQFKEDYSTKGTRQGIMIGIQMLETLIAETAQRIAYMDLEKDSIVEEFFNEVYKGEMAEQKMLQAFNEALAAKQRMELTEGFDGYYECLERKRDLTVVHAAHEIREFERKLESIALKDEKDKFLLEYEMSKQMKRLRQDEDVFKADLKEMNNILKKRSIAEWTQKHEG